MSKVEYFIKGSRSYNLYSVDITAGPNGIACLEVDGVVIAWLSTKGELVVCESECTLTDSAHVYRVGRIKG